MVYPRGGPNVVVGCSCNKQPSGYWLTGRILKMQNAMIMKRMLIISALFLYIFCFSALKLLKHTKHPESFMFQDNSYFFLDISVNLTSRKK